MKLRAQLIDLFGEDDGTFPEVRLHGLDMESGAAAIALLKRMSVSKGEDEPDWDSGEPFLVTLQVGETQLPEVGVQPWHGNFAIDWQMGEGWTDAAIRGLFGLIRQMCALDDDITVSVPMETKREVQDVFYRTWKVFLASPEHE